MPKRLENIFRYCLYAVLFVPLLYGHPFIFPFIVLKASVFQALVGVLTALYVSLVALGRLPRPRLGRIGFAFLILLGILFATSLFGVDIHRSLWSTEERELGLIVFAHAFLFFAMLKEYGSRLPWERFFSVSLIVAAIASLFAFVNILFPAVFFEHIDGFSTRPGSFFGNPTFLAAYLLPHIFFALFYAVKKFRTARVEIATLYVGAVLLMTTVLFLTQTRGALLGFGAGIGAIVLWYIWHGEHVRVGGFSLRKVAIGALGAIITVTALFWFTRAAPFWKSVPGISRLTELSLNSPDIQPRLIALKISWEAFRERPLIGYGYENYKYPFDAHYEPVLLRSGVGETFFDKPHNVFAEMAVVGGLGGFLAYIFFLGIIGWQIVRNRELGEFAPFGLAILVSYAVQNTFVFDTLGALMAFSFFAAFVESSADEAKKEHGVPMKFFRPIAFGAGLLSLGWIFVQGSILFVNYNHYLMLNYFLNNVPDKALAAYHTGLRAPISPYGDILRRDFASALSQMFAQGSPIPDIKNRAAEAVTALTGVIERTPKDYYLRVVFGDAVPIFSGLDKTYIALAAEQLQVALTLSPRRQQTLYAIAKVKLLEGKPSEAVKVMQQAIDLDPQVGDSYFYYGLIALQTGERAGGLAAIETAERIGRVPKNASEARFVANQYADADEYQKALALYAKAMEMDPNDLESRLKMGIVYYFIGDNDAARRYIREVQRHVDLRKDNTYDTFKPIYDELHVFE